MLEFLPRIVFRVPTQLMRRFYLRLANHFTTKSFFGLLVIRSSDYVNRLKIFLGLQFYRNWWITQSSSIDLAHFCFNVWINRFVECVQKWTGWCVEIFIRKMTNFSAELENTLKIQTNSNNNNWVFGSSSDVKMSILLVVPSLSQTSFDPNTFSRRKI